MHFRVQNLGPLRDAEVDLSKDLIVLAGPNNAGKTYLAWSVYGLHRFQPKQQPVLAPWARRLIESADHAIDLDQLWAESGDELLNGVAAEYQSKVHLCFATERSQFASASIRLAEGKPRHSTHIYLDPFKLAQDAQVWSALLYGAEPGRAHWMLIEGDLGRVTGVLLALSDDKVAATERNAATTSLASRASADAQEDNENALRTALQAAVLSEVQGGSVIFPAERIAVNIFAKELALKRSELVDELVDVDLDGQLRIPMDVVRRKAGRYPWPIRDSLKIANDLANLRKVTTPFADLADELEAAVLGGGLRVSETGEMLFTPGGEGSPHLQMHLTASVVKSLSSLVFYFRHLAAQGDFLIIDEPELNLHPDNQRKVARILAKAVRRGFKVMMSTHSDYVLRELNHLIMLSKLPDEARSLGYDPEHAIAPEKVGVYLFDEQRSEPVPVEETGFSIKTIDAVVNQLNADEQRLYARLFDKA